MIRILYSLPMFVASVDKTGTEGMPYFKDGLIIYFKSHLTCRMFYTSGYAYKVVQALKKFNMHILSTCGVEISSLVCLN